MEKVKPVIGRVGGKSRIAPWIIEHLSRFQWSIYCEPFAGSAAVYFRLVSEGVFEQIRARGHHPRIVLNDADSRIVQLFRTVRDHPDALAHAVRYTPYSREEHRLAQQPVEDLGDVELARRYLVKSWQSFEVENRPGRVNTTWGYGTSESSGKRESAESRCTANGWHTLPDRILAASPHLQGEASPVDSPKCLNATGLKWLAGSAVEVEQARRYLVDGWQSFKKMSGDSWGVEQNCHDAKTSVGVWHTLPHRILTATDHLKRCYIENDDAVKVIERWSTPHTCFYVDPPYYDCSHYYKEQFDNDQHARLAEALHRVDAACVVVSYYPHPEILALYPEETWERHYKETVASSAGITRNSKTKTRPKRTELLLVRKAKGEAPKVNFSGQLGLF